MFLLDETRLAAIRTGAASGAVYVTIQTADLRWLLDLIDALRGPGVPRDILATLDTPATDFESN